MGRDPWPKSAVVSSRHTGLFPISALLPLSADDESMRAGRANLEPPTLPEAVDAIVSRWVRTAMASDAPGFELADLIDTQMALIQDLADHYEAPFSREPARALASALMSNTVGLGVLMGISKLGKSVPVLSALLDKGGVKAVRGALTFAVGHVAYQLFAGKGSLAEFEAKKWQRTFRVRLNQSDEKIRGLMHSI